MSAEHEPGNDDYSKQVADKVQRLSRARQRRAGLWRHVAHVGSLGFMFVLPLVAGAALGRAVAARTGHPAAGLALLMLGLGVGAFASWRSIRQGIGGAEE